MATLMGREASFVLMAGLFAQFIFPLMRQTAGMFSVGAVMGLTFMPIHAIVLLGGRRMTERVRGWVGVGAWLLAFGPDLGLTWVRTGQLASPAVAVPALVGLLLTGVAGLVPPKAGGPGAEALWGLYAYSLSMLGVRWLLVPMLGGGEFAVALALGTGAFYMGLRSLARLFWPSAVEAKRSAEPVVHRPVPDRVVGLFEGTTQRRARPFATRPDGSLDENAVSVLCSPEQVAGVERQMADLLADKPFTVSVGQAVEGRVEVVVRPRVQPTAPPGA